MKLWQMMLAGFIALVISAVVTLAGYVAVAWIIVKVLKGMDVL